MKTRNSKTTCTRTGTQAKAGILTTNKIKEFLHINNTISSVANPVSAQTLTITSHEEELAYEIEAELKKAQARTYANAYLIR